MSTRPSPGAERPAGTTYDGTAQDGASRGGASLPRDAVVVGGGVAGLTVGLALARAGVRVHRVDDGRARCSDRAGGMLAPYCELDGADPAVVRAGLGAVAGWQALLGERAEGVVADRGSLVIAHRPDRPLLRQLADRVRRAGHGERLTALDRRGLAEAEPLLADRFDGGWLVGGEGQVHPRHALDALADLLADAGATHATERATDLAPGRVTVEGGALRTDLVVDARGVRAADALPVRAVRGEYVLAHAPEARLQRPVRLAHPRYPLYVVPRPGGRVYVGATQLERAGAGGVTVRSALELLSALYSVHPSLGEAAVLEVGAGERPAVPDNAPWLRHRPGLLEVNGLFRHGWLLAPRLSRAAVDLLSDRDPGPDVAPFVRLAA